MRMSDPALSIGPSPSQISRKCAACEEEEKTQVLRPKLAMAKAATCEAPAVVHQVLRSPGQPLDVRTRTYFETRFGHDFSGVRVHTDDRAAASAASIGASAYTTGIDIAFSTGRYDPASSSGRRLLAHELAHVVQQDSADHNGASSESAIVQRDTDSEAYRQGYQHGLKGDDPHPGPLNAEGLADYDKGYAKGRAEFTPGPGAAPAGTACTTTYKKASSFQELIDLVRAAETALSAAGITTPKDQIHAIRGIYYGTLWSLDYSVEKSQTRNEGFQRFTRPSEDVAKSVPPDIQAALSCGLFDALKNSQDMVDSSGRQVDFGQLIIGLDAREDPALASNIKYPVKLPIGSIDIDLGGTGTELVTWIGDLGGGAASLANTRATAPATSASAVFTGSDYGGSINLEGDIAGSVVATSSPSAVTAPNVPSGKRLSDVLQEYLSPAAPSAAWRDRATTFLTMNGGTFDAAGTLTNRAALIAKFAPKIQDFACNYLASRVKDKHITVAAAKAAANHVIPSSHEVATAFVDALDDSHKSGGKIEAKRFPAPSAAQPGACANQINLAGAASLIGL
jgi:hypothetical protein